VTELFLCVLVASRLSLFMLQFVSHPAEFLRSASSNGIFYISYGLKASKVVCLRAVEIIGICGIGVVGGICAKSFGERSFEEAEKSRDC